MTILECMFVRNVLGSGGGVRVRLGIHVKVYLPKVKSFTKLNVRLTNGSFKHWLQYVYLCYNIYHDYKYEIYVTVSKNASRKN